MERRRGTPGARTSTSPTRWLVRAQAVRDAIAASIVTLPEQLRRSLTWDQGAELAQHAQLRIDTGLQVFFCDPHSPWQRGTNENTNGLLRQYFPKGTDLSKHSAGDLRCRHCPHSRPRKTLAWKPPPRPSTSYCRTRQQQPVLRRPLEPKQYTSLAFGRRLQQAGLVASRGSIGDALDNAVAESFFATLECELLDRYHWPTRQALRTAVFDFIEIFYNRQRRHSTLDYLTPVDYEHQRPSPAPAA
jgi:hypothetical protein